VPLSPLPPMPVDCCIVAFDIIFRTSKNEMSM